MASQPSWDWMAGAWAWPGCGGGGRASQMLPGGSMPAGAVGGENKDYCQQVELQHQYYNT